MPRIKILTQDLQNEIVPNGEETVSVSKYYGTNASGQKGFHNLPVSAPANTTPIMGSSTTSVANITTTGADLIGTYTSNGGATITATGFVLYPAGNASTIIGGANVQNFADATLPSPISATASGLSSNTNYCFKPYATNSVGTSYGSEICFTTLSPQYVFISSEQKTLSVNTSGLSIIGPVTPGANNFFGGFVAYNNSKAYFLGDKIYEINRSTLAVIGPAITSALTTPYGACIIGGYLYAGYRSGNAMPATILKLDISNNTITSITNSKTGGYDFDFNSQYILVSRGPGGVLFLHDTSNNLSNIGITNNTDGASPIKAVLSTSYVHITLPTSSLGSDRYEVYDMSGNVVYANNIGTGLGSVSGMVATDTFGYLHIGTNIVKVNIATGAFTSTAVGISGNTYDNIDTLKLIGSFIYVTNGSIVKKYDLNLVLIGSSSAFTIGGSYLNIN